MERAYIYQMLTERSSLMRDFIHAGGEVTRASVGVREAKFMLRFSGLDAVSLSEMVCGTYIFWKCVSNTDAADYLKPKRVTVQIP